MMCSDAEDLHRRAGWDGASGESRRQLLDTLQGMIFITISIIRIDFPHRVHSIRCHDSTTAVCDLARPGKDVSTAAVHLSQLLLGRQIVFPLRRSQMQQSRFPEDHHYHSPGPQGRSVEYRMESQRGLPCLCKQGQDRHHLETRSASLVAFIFMTR